MATMMGEKEIITSREFDYPRERLFDAWTDPAKLARWWGPHGFTNTFRECDIRPGGQWKFVMHGPNGVDYENHNEFLEVVPHERIVLRHLLAPEFTVTATFEDIGGGRAKLTFRQTFESAAVFENVKTYAADGNEQNFDRLGAIAGEE